MAPMSRIAHSCAALRRRRCADVWRSADPNNRMPLPFIQHLEQSLPKNRSVDARTSDLRKRYSRFVHCAFPFNNERGPIFRTGKLMFSSVDIQDLYAVMLACCDPAASRNLKSACQVPHGCCFVAYAWLTGNGPRPPRQGAAFQASV